MADGWIRARLGGARGPRSLYGRAALIVFVPIVTLQLAISIGFVQRHFEDVTRQMTRAVGAEIAYLAGAVAAAEGPEAAREEIATLAPALAFEVALPAPEPAPDGDSWRWYDLTAGRVASELRERVPGIAAIRMPDSRDVTLWVETPQGTMRVGFVRERVSASNPHQLLVLIVVLGAVMAGIAYLFLRNQLRPIARMAQAAGEYGRGRIVPYRPSGAAEVRAAGAAFLDMRARIERQTQARTMMLSGVSHDLRTPLTRLKLELSLLEDEVAAPMRRDVDEMQRLIDAFLDFARGDAGDADGRADPAELAEAVVAEAARTGGAVRFAGVEGDRAAVACRPEAVRRAVSNLVANALRHGDRAEVSVQFGDRSVRIRVEDDGPGIPADQREQAVRPFVRLDPARNQDRGSGVGLGLAIVADVARGHGGILRLGESALGGLQADLVLPR
ncbi:ATP-binding protein [Wenxinia saemankumensis]|uniref:histidine kinase n=1 Tax=Wenxinia saemankumensis TaxID=1447782 RepID=A0A1M6HXP3_9RHOB|nr:ATP-binding protein [Wenxinia saemankumensis]SHJ26990.1 two-component system, OmpR family, osmolarity sensor histidine kinase EnvZ [Wenxinia saemankumensis]